jgi:hypothetical protein
MTNAELDDLALRSDANQGARVIEETYAFLGRFVSYPGEHAHVAHALMVRAHASDGVVGVYPTSRLPVSRTRVRKNSGP